MLSPTSLPLVLSALSLLPHTAAQIPNTFRWDWGVNPPPPSTLPECNTFQVVVTPLNGSQPSPPYYMVALEASGISTTSNIGTDPADLWWQANHKNGQSVMLAVVDSTGATGGVSSTFWTMSGGDDTSCTSGLKSSAAAITANVTTQLNTCDAWGLTVVGGESPFTIVLAQPGSSVLTVVSLSQGYDLLTYINRATPGEPLMAAVYDATGLWGKSSPAVDPTGGIQVDCGSAITVQGNSLNSTQSGINGTAIAVPLPTGTSVAALPTATAASDHVSLGVPVGVGVGVGVPVIAVAAVLLFIFCLKRRRPQGGAATIDRYEQPYPSMGYIQGAVTTPYTHSTKSPTFTESRMPSTYTDTAPAFRGFPEPMTPNTPSYGFPELMTTTAPSRSSAFSEPYSQARSLTPTQLSDAPLPMPAAAQDEQPRVPGDFNPYNAAVALVGAAPAVFSQDEKLRAANDRMNESRSTSSKDSTGLQPSPTYRSAASPLVAGPSRVPEEIFVQHRDSGIPARDLPPPYAGSALSRATTKAALF
ncbi:hypothetical protein PsYK624_126240 [Phanerochaete sordida]|uniref:Transmembrane protein n=1 Tax=Phanerochaete sordida TaxID=48140 RepID=A0A9P3GIZ5_9APHY|nr:hypothetical protein PsYK624_126240 [Phanerochaete sordida]